MSKVSLVEFAAQSKSQMKKGIDIQRGNDFLKVLKPLSWIYRGLIVKNYLYTLTSPTNHGKTTLISTLIGKAIKGEDFGCFKNSLNRPAKVLLLCGENDIDTGMKLYATKNYDGISEESFRENLFMVTESFSMASEIENVIDAANELNVEFDLVIADTWQAYWSGGDFNSNDAQLAHAKALRMLTSRINGKPACIVPAHPVKSATKDNLVPYGGNAAMNEIDTNLMAWNTDGVIELFATGKRRQPEVESCFFELKQVTIPQLVDDEGMASTSVIAVQTSSFNAEAIEHKSLDMQDAIHLIYFEFEAENMFRPSVKKIETKLKERSFDDATPGKIRTQLNNLTRLEYLGSDKILTSKGKKRASELSGYAR